MFRFLIAAVVVLIAALPAPAEKMKVYSLDAGLYAVQGDGIVEVELVKPDDPTPKPQPDIENDRAKAFTEAAKKATSDPNPTQTAWKLATAYRGIVGKISTGEIAPDQEIMATWVKLSTDLLISDRKTKEAWQPLRDLFAEEWALLINKGARAADYSALLTDCAVGLESVGPKPQSFEVDASSLFESASTLIAELEAGPPQAVPWAEVLKIVMAILQMLSELLG